ncbi:hypothetical protein V7S43_006814 [Phytophthora oleae]|uniref:Uncharacterized protein n=1 Tax=Phytophthora oleae TaxID=2107226 RepID=A0ABD3FM13_9STRA
MSCRDCCGYCTMRARLSCAMRCCAIVLDAAFKCIGRTRTAACGERQARQVDITATCSKPASHESIPMLHAPMHPAMPRVSIAQDVQLGLQDQMLAMQLAYSTCTVVYMLDACQEDGSPATSPADRFRRSSSLQRSFQLQRAGSGSLL